MNWSNVIDSQDEQEWFEEYVRVALASPAPALPPASQQIGPTRVLWFETGIPKIAHIHTTGGTYADQTLAEVIVREQLRGHGFKQAEYTFEHDEDFRKTAAWTDLEAKAKRLIQSGNVTVAVNTPTDVVGKVIGDHGTYQTTISRQDPSSAKITQWTCECPWNQYAFQRTRQWKKYEGRPCAHVLALYWKAKSTPIDNEYDPATGQNVAPQQNLFDMPRDQNVPSGMQNASPFAAPVQPSQGEQLGIPGMNPGQAQGTPPGPSILPQFPMDPSLMPPPPNPASVPGLKQPSPTNPVQYPGGTFSSWQFQASSDTMWHMSADLVNGQMVSTKYEDWGTLIGRSEEHGSGQSIKIPAKSVGEVLGTDPVTKMVNVLFENKMTENMGKLEPNGVVAWFLPSEIEYRPDIRQPGPAVKRY